MSTPEVKKESTGSTLEQLAKAREAVKEKDAAKRARLLNAMEFPKATGAEEKSSQDKALTPTSKKELPKDKSQLTNEIKTLTTGAEREKAICETITKSDLPEFQNVHTKMKDANGVEHDVQFSITKDCLSVGGKRMPMTPETAQRIAKRFDLMLPTKEIIDRVLEDPGFNKVVMPALPPGPQMASEEYYQKHNDMVQEAIKSANFDPKKGVIGPKKIIIIDERLNDNPDKLAFHGGLKPDGTLWQNADLAHNPQYVDYSHGVMLLERKWVIDGKEMDVMDVIRQYPGIVGTNAQFNPDAFYKPSQDRSAAEVKDTVPTGTTIDRSEMEVKNNVPVKSQQYESPVAPLEEVSSQKNPVQIPSIPEPVQNKIPTPDMYVPAHPSSTISAPPSQHEGDAKETREATELRPIKGSTLFAGDSNMKYTPSQGLEVDGIKETLAENGKTSAWLLQEMRKLEASGRIKQFQNFVCLIGTNDIGGAETAEQIFDHIKDIWEIARRNGLKVYGCTVPPFRGWGNYSSRYDQINKKRQELNALILDDKTVTKIIPLHAIVSLDDDKLSPEFNKDNLHINGQEFAKLLQKEVSENQKD